MTTAPQSPISKLLLSELEAAKTKAANAYLNDEIPASQLSGYAFAYLTESVNETVRRIETGQL